MDPNILKINVLFDVVLLISVNGNGSRSHYEYLYTYIANYINIVTSYYAIYIDYATYIDSMTSET